MSEEELLYEKIYRDTQGCGRTQFVKLLQQNLIKIKQLKEEINKISKKELKVMQMLRSIEYGTLTKERIDQIEEVMFELEKGNSNG